MYLWKWFKKPLPSPIVQQLIMRQFPPILVVRELSKPRNPRSPSLDALLAGCTLTGVLW